METKLHLYFIGNKHDHTTKYTLKRTFGIAGFPVNEMNCFLLTYKISTI